MAGSIPHWFAVLLSSPVLGLVLLIEAFLLPHTCQPLTPLQFNCVNELLLPELASAFQAAGFTVLVYDTRCVGASDGLPRNDMRPQKQVEDYHDAVTFLKQHPLEPLCLP